MPRTYQEIQSLVRQRIKARTLKSLVNYVRRKNPKLWVVEKPHPFVNKSVYVALFKDMFCEGYNPLAKEFKDCLQFLPRA